MILVLTVFILFSSMYSLQKEALQYADPLFLIGVRMLFSGVFLLFLNSCFRAMKDKKIVNSNLGLNSIDREKNSLINTDGCGKIQRKKAFMFVMLFAFCGVYLANACEIFGLTKMHSSKTSLLYSVSPFLSSVTAYFFLSEKLSKKAWAGIVFGFTGLIPVLLFETGAEKNDLKLFIMNPSEIIVLVGVFFSVLGWVFLKKALQHHKYPLLKSNGLSMFVGGGIILIHSLFLHESWTVSQQHLKTFIGSTVLMALISNVFCYNLYGYLLKKFSATFMSFAGLLTPCFAILFGYMFLNEPIYVVYFLSILLFAAGLMFFYYEEIVMQKKLKLQSSILKNNQGFCNEM